MGVLPQQRHNNTKPLNFQFHDQDSSSTQSTDQSHPEVGSAQSCQISIQCSISSSHSKCSESGGGLIRSSLGNQSFCFPAFQVDHNQSIAHIAFRHTEPCFDGVLAAYGPQSKIHQAQLMGLTSSVRVPLPFDLTEEPIYVNAKQYHAILRRRKYRAKLEAQNRLIKARKPYLHESRHLHALRRARGSGGRFLNNKQLQEANLKADSYCLKVLEGTRLNLGHGNLPESKNHGDVEKYRDGAGPTGSDITSAPNNSDGMFQQRESGSFRLSSYPPHFGWNMQGYPADPGTHGGGSQQHVSVLM